jgi:hypothetical protein
VLIRLCVSHFGGLVERLYELSIEVRDLVQSKVGTTAFSSVWEQLRKRSVEKRGNRKSEQHRMVSVSVGFLRKNDTDGFVSGVAINRLLRILKPMDAERNNGRI